MFYNIYGRNSVVEALKAKRKITEIYISKTARRIDDILNLAKLSSVVVKFVDPEKLNVYGQKTQGVVAFCSDIKYVSLEDIINFAKNKNKAPFILICDRVQDPHNLGALFRTAYAVGVDGVILPKRRTAPINAVVEKASAGAVNFLNIAKVANIVSTINILKKIGIFIYCADGAGKNFYNVNFKGGAALIVGSEGSGAGKLIKKNSDVLCGVPMVNAIDSLNVSVAAALILYEIYRQNL